MSQTERKPGYYAILTAEVRYDKKLTADEKLLYAEITALTQMNGACYAPNRYFAELFSCEERTIRRRLEKLEKSGYIERIVIYKDGTREIEKRFIKLCCIAEDRAVPTPGQNCPHPEDRTVRYINNPTDSNNIYNLDTSSLRSEVSSLTERINQIFEKYGLPLIRKMTAERLKKLRMRTVEVGGLGNFLEEIDKALAASSFLRGENDRGWSADIDFLLQKSSFVRLLEGAYADKNSRNDDPEEFILGEHL